MSPTVFPLIDVNDIIRAVGGASFSRGQGYAKGGAVLDLDWDAHDQRLSARVQGNDAVPYRTNIQLTRKGGGSYAIVDGLCSCPVSYDCKHVAAAAVRSNMAHILEGPRTGEPPKAPKPAPSGWKESLTALLGNSAEGADGQAGTPPSSRSTAKSITPLGLQFELRTEPPATAWGSRSPNTAKRRLGVRPVVRSSKGNWVMNNLSWKNIGFQTYGLHLDKDQHRWFSQFPALHKDNGTRYFGQNDSWLFLDHFANPLLWQLLQEAVRLGIELVGTRKNVVIAVGAQATLCLDAIQTEHSIRLCPGLEIDGGHHRVDTAGLIGDHGIYTATPELITLAPTAKRLGKKDRQLLKQTSPVIIPDTDADLFLERFYPQLRQSVPVISSDESVQLPEIKPPTLVLTASFQPGHRLALEWDWQYGEGSGAVRKPLHDDGAAGRDGDGGRAAGRDGDGGTAGGDGDGGYRDRPAETELLAAAANVLGEPVIARRSLQDMDAADFTQARLPGLQAADGFRVDVIGDQPDYRELTETPRLKISTVETDQPDWFDLGVMVTVAGHTIPFDNIFRALAKGRKKLLMANGSYLSLQQDVFNDLHELIDEAKELQEWDTGLRISRYQASLWSEFEDLAEDTEQARGWRSAVSGLLELQEVESTPLPPGVHAALRPYQLTGFNWLTFLWRHNLGGILADDMGLGKTLQALALMEYARNEPVRDEPLKDEPFNDKAARGRSAATEPSAPNSPRPPPFLVVAPTSVVPNWLTEAQRFTPNLRVVGITDTQAKSGVAVAALVAEADVVVTSYTLFRLDTAAYGGQEWSGLILDEAQFVKNRATRAHQFARDLKAPFKLAITGTPMENNLMELWSLFAIVAPGLFPSARKFAQDYQRPIERQGAEDLLDKLRRRIRPLMMRRTKEVVAKDLPAKQEQELRIELDPKHRKIYDTFLQRERQKLLGLLEDFDRNKVAVFRSLTLLRMLSLDASLVDEKYASVPSRKLGVLFEQLDDVLSEGHRSLVFSQFTSFLKKAAAELDERGIEYCYLDGSTRRRAEVIERFKSGQAPVFLISLKAGGFGLNLTEADYCFLLDPWWNPATEAQAVDRTHRIGQTRNVMVYRMVSAGTIEEKVMALKGKKAKLFASVMNDGAVFGSALTAQDIRGLLDA